MSIFKLRIRPSNRLSNLRFLFVALLFLAIVYLCLSLPLHLGDQWEWNWSLQNNSNNVCPESSGLERVVITVKTGATEAQGRIPTQLRTSLRCAPHVYVFSDMAQNIGDIEIYDALDEIPAEVTDGNPDFDIYRKQKVIEDPAQIPNILGNFKNPQSPDDLAAWTLDKYKNLHIVEAAWALKPDMNWYLHIDADTYVMWSSLTTWIKKLDPSRESFFGSLVYLEDKPFAHGGSGMLISKEATRKFAVTHNGTAAQWDSKIQENCCGDYVLAQAFHEYGVEVSNSRPTINGERPDTIPFDSGNWCEPVVTMHHVASADAMGIAEFEQRRKCKTAPVTHSEIFQGLVSDKIPDFLADWDNMSEDETVTDVDSAEHCTEACTNNVDCFQSLYDGNDCTLGTKSFRLGQKHEPEHGEIWQSSWNRTRIAAWVSKQKPCTKLIFPFQE